MDRIIIGDVHGYFETLMSLLNLINPSKQVGIYFLGDLIDRGPKSKEVLDFVKAQQYTVLLGNHEELLLTALQGDSMFEDHWRVSGGKATLKSFAVNPHGPLDVLKPYQSWIKSFPLYLDLGDLFLVHAGIDPSKPLQQQSAQDFCWTREIFHESTQPYFKDKIIVAGHTPTVTMGLSAGQIAIGPGWINIDTGVHLARSGWLTALYWEQRKLYQVNAQTKERRILEFQEWSHSSLPIVMATPNSTDRVQHTLD
ncbi:metallophosphoesterase family protein [Leptolyngbya sp. AN03gr2]|uniref:metallophosphoesterase family protein n=1 Tax=unclassified Leptolyngbya TaxID=2650499 RepID=UPI003D313DC9